jgi:hypothetical protein
MSALSIQPTYPILTDIDGQPLEDGFIWIGAANLDPQTNPIAVYWDAALTQVATQPIRTRGGYPLNGTSPGRLYVNSDYSIRVQNRNGSTLYSAPVTTERYGNIIISSADVTFLQAGTGAVTRTAQAKMRETVSVLDFGAVGDGVTDDTAAIQTALNSGAKSILVPAGTFLLTAPLDIPSGVRVYGEGRDSVLTMTGSANPKIFSLTSKSSVVIEALRFVPQSTGTDRTAVYLNLCQSVTVRDCFVYGHTDASGIYMVDSDYCLADNLYFDGGALLNAYAVYMAGCKGCKAVNSTAYRPNFGFVVVGKDIYPASTRTTEEAFGSIIDSCVVRNHSGHAYDINSATGTIISNCSAEDYAGVSTNVAFQIKHPSGDNTRQNVITGCTAQNVPSGFGMQEGSNAVFIGCTATNVTKYGFMLNSSNRSQFVGCTAREFGEYGIWVSSTSARNVFSGIVLETSTATAVGIGLLSSGASNNEFDCIQMVGTLAYGIDIVSGANNNKFGRNTDVNQQPIRDLSGNTYWPIIIVTPEISVAGTGNVQGPYMHRGMFVAVARAVITATISGTPQVNCGRLGANTEIAAAQTISGSAGATVTLTQASQLLNTAAIMQGRVNVAGSAGTIYFQYEGLPRV